MQLLGAKDTEQEFSITGLSSIYLIANLNFHIIHRDVPQLGTFKGHSKHEINFLVGLIVPGDSNLVRLGWEARHFKCSPPYNKNLPD